MREFLVRRTLQAVAVMLCISAITFFVLNIVPGDPVRIMLGDMASEEALETVRHRMGLDQPILKQYITWLTNMLHGDFGVSYFQRAPVMQLLGRSLAVTARLAGFAYLFALISGVTIGVLAAVNHGNAIDRALIVGPKAPAAEEIARGIADQTYKEFCDGHSVRFGEYFYGRPYLDGTCGPNGNLTKGANSVNVRLYKGEDFNLSLSDFAFSFEGEGTAYLSGFNLVKGTTLLFR